MLDAFTACNDLAPLHNPANLKGVNAVSAILPDVPQIGVFDTAFHQTMPDYAYLYAVPYELYEKYGVRRYGLHGTSHRLFTALGGVDIILFTGGVGETSGDIDGYRT